MKKTDHVVYAPDVDNPNIDTVLGHIQDLSKVSTTEIEKAVANYDSLECGTILFSVGDTLGWRDLTEGLFRATEITVQGLEDMRYINLHITEPMADGYCVREYAVAKTMMGVVEVTTFTTPVHPGDFVLQDVDTGELYVVSRERFLRDFEAVSTEFTACYGCNRDDDEYFYRVKSPAKVAGRR